MNSKHRSLSYRGAARRGRVQRTVGLAVEALEVRQVLSTTPYLVPTAAGVSIAPILTTGDTVGSDYTMFGTPDGLGAFDNGDGTFTLVMNHEFSLSEAVGVARPHNASLLTDGDPTTNPAGSYIDRLVIRKSDLAVLDGGYQIQQVLNGETSEPLTGTALNFNRFCSGDLAAPSAYYWNGLGTQARIYLTGEETSGGRATASIISGPNSGTTYTLPALGGAPWEDLLANPDSGLTTLVMGNADTGGGKIYAYVGTKQATGNEIDQAGLTNGTTYEVKDNGDGTFSLVASGQGTGFNRPEDGAWDPVHPNDYYFVTTASFTGNTQLWRLRYNDRTDPLAGGSIEVLVNGQNVGKMFDNITINDRGQIVLQEDVGNNPRVGKVWMYDTTSHALVEIAQHNPDLFAPGSPNLLTQDEESSGVIDVSSILGEGTYLLDVQAHYDNGVLVQGGQLLVMRTGVVAGLGYDATSITPTTPATPNILVVLGTSGSDHIGVTQSGSSSTVSVRNRRLGQFTGAVNRVIVVGYDGNDHIDLSGVQADATVYAGDGNDHIIGSSGDNDLEGGTGNDHATELLIDFGIGNDKVKKKK